jgi:putative aminopeptidase FrvX
MDQTISLLKNLTEAYGVSGYEAPVRKVVQEYLQPLGELSRDRIGSLICKKVGTSSTPHVMIAGHMDEIGFLVKYISDEGFIRFQPLGGWFDQVLLGQRVVIPTYKGDVVGVIGVRPPHLMDAEERTKIVKKKDMYIDIGAISKDEVVEAGVRVGDPIIPRADFLVMANGKSYLSKAFDDRVGVAITVSALQDLQNIQHPNTVYGAATVTEETTLGGARTSAEVVSPDVAIILESGIAGDVPGVRPDESNVKLGKGVNMLLYDSRMIPNLKLRDLVLEIAKEIEVPIQLSAMDGGATDGGMIHLHKTGVPTVVLGVPSRHIHSHSSIIHRQDYDWSVKLVVEMIKRFDAATVASLSE